MTGSGAILAAAALVVTTAGCATLPRPAGLEWHDVRLDADGRRRTASSAIPAGAPERSPLVVVLHGAAGWGASRASGDPLRGFDGTALAREFFEAHSLDIN